MDNPQSAAIYCRLSYAPDGSLENVERQESDCRGLADRLAWPISDQHIYSDNSRSAWQRNRKRPRWDAMLQAIERREVDSLIVYHGDRLIRQPWDLELLLKLADDRHLRLASVSGVRNLSSEDDRFILRIEAAQACKASADTSRRVKRGWAARAEKGEPVGGGKRPFGYGVPTDRTGKTGKPIYDTTQRIPEEAAVLREAVERLMAGQSQGGVLAWMNEVSTTSQGNRWTSRSLQHLLLSPRIAGLVEHQGVLHRAVWEPIVRPEEWEDVKLILRTQAEGWPYPGRERRYLLSGVAECYKCHTTMRVKPSGGRNRKTARLYHCPNPQCEDRVARNVTHLDEYVTGRVLRRLQDPELMKRVLGSSPGVSAEIAALERRRAATRETLRNLVDHPEYAGDVAASLAGFDRRIRQLRDRHAASARQRLLAQMAGITPEQWEGTPLDVQAATVRALFRVIILPATWRGPGFDPASVRLKPVAEHGSAAGEPAEDGHEHRVQA